MFVFFFPSCCFTWLTCTSVFWVHFWIAASVAAGECVCCGHHSSELCFPSELAHPSQAFLFGIWWWLKVGDTKPNLHLGEFLPAPLDPCGLVINTNTSAFHGLPCSSAAVWYWWGWEEPWTHSRISGRCEPSTGVSLISSKPGFCASVSNELQWWYSRDFIKVV